MIHLFRISFALALLTLAAHTTYACSCVVDPLGKRFRDAKAVFIGMAVGEEPQDKSLIQNVPTEEAPSQVLEVVKSFKGVKRKFVSVTFDVEGWRAGLMCPTLISFKQQEQYLVFAYGKNYEVRTVCSDTHVITTDSESVGYEWMQRDVKKLGSRWFRIRARLNPF